MKILCISQYYTPDVTAAAFRISESVSILRAKGHEVYVITSYPHKSDVLLDKGREEAESYVERLPVNAIKGTGVFGYIEQYLGFAKRAFFTAIRLHKKHNFDVIWASSPPLFIGLTTLLMKLLLRMPVVFDIRDIWPASAVDIGKIKKGSLMERMGAWLEAMIYRRSDAITCVTNSIRDYICSKTKKPVEVVYNGVMIENLRSATSDSISQRTICYAGNLGHAQGLDVVISAFERLVKTPGFEDCRLRLIGGGAVEDDLRKQVRENSLEKSIDFVGILHKNQVFSELSNSGVLLVPLLNKKTFENAIPSKIFDYMAVGNPIVATIRGEAADILGETGGNIVVPPGDVDALYMALYEVQSRWSAYAIYAKNNISQVKTCYSREANTAVLERVLAGVCKGDMS